MQTERCLNSDVLLKLEETFQNDGVIEKRYVDSCISHVYSDTLMIIFEDYKLIAFHGNDGKSFDGWWTYGNIALFSISSNVPKFTFLVKDIRDLDSVISCIYSVINKDKKEITMKKTTTDFAHDIVTYITDTLNIHDCNVNVVDTIYSHTNIDRTIELYDADILPIVITIYEDIPMVYNSYEDSLRKLGQDIARHIGFDGCRIDSSRNKIFDFYTL